MLSKAEIFPIISAADFVDLIEKNPKITSQDLQNLKPRIMLAGIQMEDIMLDTIKYLVKYGPIAPCRLETEEATND